MSISINPTNQHVFISGAYDAFAKLWDILSGNGNQHGPSMMLQLSDYLRSGMDNLI